MRSRLLFHLGLLLMLFSLSACSDSTQSQQGQQTQQEKRETQQEQGSQQNERTRVIERTVVKTVEAPKETADERQAPAAQEEKTSEKPAPEKTLALQYQYLNEGNYDDAYNLFAEQSKQLVSVEEYRAWFENAGNYQITNFSFPTVQVEDNTATVVADLTATSDATGGDQYQRTQEMQLEDGSWRVVMRGEQVELFAGTYATQVPEVQQPEDTTIKQVTVEISSDVPADVSIVDDNFDVSITEEITGSETYEFEIAADSGLLVDAYSETMSGNISIAVYENGELVTEDNSSEGYAQVMY